MLFGKCPKELEWGEDEEFCTGSSPLRHLPRVQGRTGQAASLFSPFATWGGGSAHLVGLTGSSGQDAQAGCLVSSGTPAPLTPSVGPAACVLLREL